MKIFNVLQKLSLATALFFSYHTFAESTRPAPQDDPQIESIFNYTIDEHGIGFRVYTGGCTCKKSFNLAQSDSNGGKTTKLTLLRISPDYCKGRFPEGTFVWYSFEELNLRPNSDLQIENPQKP